MHLMRSSKTIPILLLTLFTISLGQTTSNLMTYTATDIDPATKEITITFTVPEKDFIYKDFITCSVDAPTVSLSPWKANKQTVAHYDPSFKESKHVFNENFAITMTASSLPKASTDKQCSSSNSVHLYCSYYRQSEKKINHVLFPLLFTATNPTPTDMIDSTIEKTEHSYTTIKTKKTTTYLDDYVITTLCIAHIIVTSLRTHHKKYFALIIFLICVLIACTYFFRKKLHNQIKIKELLEIIISLLIVASTTYLLMYVHAISMPLVTMIMACVCALCAGLFYIKKSTKVKSKNLRTFCTFLGIICICSALLLSFKALQCADEQFNLL